MSVLNPPVLGLALLLLGIGIYAITLLILRALPQTRPRMPIPDKPLPLPPNISSHSEGVLLIQPGGRVAYINQQARHWFNTSDLQPSLERLGRRTQPSEVFWGLCVTEGQARLNLDGRSLEATSYQVPSNAGDAMMITLHRPQLVLDVASSQPEDSRLSISHQAFSIYAELSQKMAANLDLDSTLIAILEGVERLIPSDFPEITVWDPVNRNLVAYHLVGIPELNRRLEKSASRYTVTNGYSSYLITKHLPLLVADVDTFHEARPAAERRQHLFSSYLGIPLIFAGELVGTIELASMTRDAFTSTDLEALRLLSGQAAVALHNALLFEEQQKRTLELAGLAKLAQSVSSLNGPQDLYARLVESISPLIAVEVLGFLIYNPNQNALEAATPFQGVEPNILGWTKFAIPPGSPAEDKWNSQEIILASQALSDSRLQAFGLDHLARAAGVQQAVLIPLATGGRMLGYLMVGDKQDGSSFDQADMRLLSIISAQAAAIIDNAVLIQQAQHRAQRAETLRRITSLTGSSATRDEILKYSVQDLARLLQADKAAIYLLDETRDELVLHASSLFGVPPETAGKLARLSAVDPQFHLSVTASQRPFFSDELLEDKRIIPLYQPLVAKLDIRSALVAPLVVRNHALGEIMLGNRLPHFFNHSDLQILITAAGHLAGAIEADSPITQTDESLRRRIHQLVALTRVSRELNSSVELKHLLQRVYDEAVRSTSADCGTILLFQISDDPAYQPAAQIHELGGSPTILFQVGDPPSEELQPLEHRALSTGESLIVSDFSHLSDLGKEQAATPAVQILPAHPEVSSALIVPIACQERVAGLIHLHSRLPHHFDSSAQEIVEALAFQAAIALGNAHRHQELSERNLLLSQRYKRVRAGMETAQIINSQADRQSALLALGRELVTNMGLDVSLVVEPDTHGMRLVQVLGHVPAETNLEALLGQRNPLHQCMQTGVEILVPSLEPESEWSSSPLLQALQAKSFVCLPLILGDHREAALLAISRAQPTPLMEDDRPLFTMLARQAAITLQNLRLLNETNRRLTEVDLLLEFSRQIGSLEPAPILQSLADTALHVAPTAQTCVITLWDAKKELLVPQVARGYRDNLEILDIHYHSGVALPGQALAERQTKRIDEVDFARHYDLPSGYLLRFRNAMEGLLPISALAVPMITSPQTDPLGVVILENYNHPAAFSSEDQALVESLAQQTALSLENSRLYQAAEQRASQLQAFASIAAIISSNLQPEELIQSLLDQLQAILPYDTGTLWLRQAEELIVRAARGFEDSDERIGIRVEITDSELLREMITTEQPISVGDVRSDVRFPALIEPQRLSWLGLPMMASGEIIGVIALEKSELNFYTAEHVQIGQTFASQAAVALENATLYQGSLGRAVELDQRSQRVEMLNRFSKELSGSLDFDHLLNFTLQEIYQNIHCATVSAILFEPDSGGSIRAEYPLPDGFLPIPLPETPLFERLRQTQGLFNTGDINRLEELGPLTEFLEQRGVRSLLAIPMVSGSAVTGVFLLQGDRSERFSSGEVGLARTLCSQAAIAIQNARLYAETVRLTEELELRVRLRTEELVREHQRTEILLRIITELSASLDLEQVLNRTLKVLNQMVDAEHITVLLARPGEKNLQHLASIGQEWLSPTEIRYTRLEADQGFAGWIIQQHKSAMIPDLQNDSRWIVMPESPVRFRSAIGVPLTVGAEALGAMLFYHQDVGHFSTDHMDLIQAAANQVAVAVNNAELYRLIRDQAEDLGNMVRSQQIETQRTKAILEDVADGVLVTDAQRNITLFNVSAEKILGLQRTTVIGKSLEFFTGLFGGAAQRWMETIRTWTYDPLTYTPGDTHEEQITLEDGRVVSVHLAPVSLRDTFLGTVSIFRDITHQVEVDRLKSEFVATVSHELRTPMTSIKGYVDILLLGAAGALNEKQTHFLEIVKANTERLTILVNDLLDISRIESGQAGLSLQPLNLVELAHAAINRLKHRSQADQKPMEIKVDIPPNLARIQGDVERVRQILDNLLENAYFYTPQNGLILLRIRQAGSELQIDIQDNGIGIPTDLQARVFERFYRGEHPFVLATSGTGLGLSVVQRLVEMHNGRIWLNSAGIPGEGSTFSFTLPLYNPEGE